MNSTNANGSQSNCIIKSKPTSASALLFLPLYKQRRRRRGSVVHVGAINRRVCVSWLPRQGTQEEEEPFICSWKFNAITHINHRHCARVLPPLTLAILDADGSKVHTHTEPGWEPKEGGFSKGGEKGGRIEEKKRRQWLQAYVFYASIGFATIQSIHGEVFPFSIKPEGWPSANIQRTLQQTLITPPCKTFRIFLLVSFHSPFPFCSCAYILGQLG